MSGGLGALGRYAVPLLAAVLLGAGIWYVFFKGQRRDYPYEAGELQAVPAGDLRVYPLLRGDGGETSVEPLAYSWESWDERAYHEREKESHETMREEWR